MVDFCWFMRYEITNRILLQHCKLNIYKWPYNHIHNLLAICNHKNQNKQMNVISDIGIYIKLLPLTHVRINCNWLLRLQVLFLMNCLTHPLLEPHICVSELGQHWFRQCLVACSVPSHYPNQCWLIVNWTFRNKLQWSFNRNSNVFIEENAI